MVQGLEKFNKRFAAIPDKVRAAAIRAMETGANELVADMKRIAPVGDYAGGGELRDSIAWTWGDAPKGSLRIGTFRGREFGGLRITVYAGRRGNGADSQGWYAHFLEFGTVKTRAYPFFFPVYRARRNRVRSRITREINKAIRSS